MTIKRTSQEFRVEEVLARAPGREISDRAGPFAIYRLAKTGLTTPEAVRRLAGEVGVPAEAVAAGGLKDKQAVTRQHVTVEMSMRRRGPAGDLLRRLRGRGWSAELLGFTRWAMEGSAIAANEFEIVVSELTGRACELMDGAAELLTVRNAARPAAGSTLRFVNYFGAQRFGAVRHGQGLLARRLVRGQFEEALRLAVAADSPHDSPRDRARKRLIRRQWGRWADLAKRLAAGAERAPFERLADGADFRDAFAALPYFSQQMHVETYQSHLWNSVAAGLIEHRCPGDRVWEAEPSNGAAGLLAPMRFVAAGAAPAELVDLIVPLPGPQTRLKPPWSHALRAVLEAEGLALPDLRVPGLKRPFFGEAPRPLMVRAEAFEMGKPEADRAGRLRRVLRFRLPRGAYATVLLAAMGQ